MNAHHADDTDRSKILLVASVALVFAALLARSVLTGSDDPVENGFDAPPVVALIDDDEIDPGDRWEPAPLGRDPFAPADGSALDSPSTTEIGPLAEGTEATAPPVTAPTTPAEPFVPADDVGADVTIPLEGGGEGIEAVRPDGPVLEPPADGPAFGSPDQDSSGAGADDF